MRITTGVRASLFILLGVVIAVSYVANNRTVTDSPESEEALASKQTSDNIEESIEKKSRVILTINGYDDATNDIIPRINLWNNYETRERIVGQVNHNEKVFLIKREGDGVFIETSAGMKGWLTYWFIKEYQ